MDNLQVLLQQYLRAAWRRRWLGIVVAWAVCVLGWIGVYALPNQYEASARIYVDSDAVLTPLLRGIAADSGPATQLEILQRTLLSRPNLDKLISKTDLDLTINAPSDRARLIQRLAEDIRVSPQTHSLFTITYRSTSPKLAHDVVQTLLTIFIENATGTNRLDMENARRFLERQISSYEQQLRASEKRRAEFRARYIDILPPEDSKPNSSVLEVARANVQQLEGRLQDATNARDTLRQELQTTPPMLVTESGAVAGVREQAVARGKSRLQEAEEQLRFLLLRDTENHPDVIAQKKLIEALRASPAEGTASPRPAGEKRAPSADPNVPKRSVPNPVYDQLKMKLVDADTQIVSLQRQRDDAVRSRDKLDKIIREQPGLMAEYQNIDRDYAVLRKNYEELLGRLQSANIAQAADTQADKVKLRLVDPPEIPRLPAAPNRVMLVSAVLGLGLMAGLGITIVLGQMDSSFSTADDLRNLGLPVLGGISMLTLEPLRRRMLVAGRFGLAVIGLIAIYGGLMLHTLRDAALI